MTVVALIIAVLASDSPPRPPWRSATSADLRVLFGLVRFRPEQIVQLLIRSRNSSGRFVRSLGLRPTQVLFADCGIDIHLAAAVTSKVK